MKRFEIDVENKTIKVLDKICFEDLYKTLFELFPNNWKEYSLIQNKSYSWYELPIPYVSKDIDNGNSSIT